ncbi:hypothetical protein [Neisseria animalis]|uniref:Lipoprotein n=1 Tax=Neisseria animalis TaxID=492 RepID=A0A5P3MP87_NEIAN|nr:hypothetical protein [Neisseria animalis]QEY23342.1 hypothetical protein D0T90_01530 [Neisseria animalis]ROW33190.1 hypothetical protein CGZ60_00265 [Neisseria animalis]VEE08720.1 Uncharacterised protein [Neisseria animalis]
MKRPLLFVLAAAFGLSACTSLDGKSAREMVQISQNRLLKQDYSFNFNGELRAYTSPTGQGIVKQVAARPFQARHEPENEETLADKQWDSMADYEALSRLEMLREVNNIGGKAADMLQAYQGAQAYLSNAKFKYSGAVDLSRKKVEVVPVLELDNRNEYHRVSFPMLLDGNDFSLTVDFPATFPLITGFFVEEPMRRRLVDEPLKVLLPEEIRTGLPLNHAAEALLKANAASFGALPPEAYTLEKMDAFGSKHGARYRVHYVLDSHNRKLMAQRFAEVFDAEMNRLQQTPERGTYPQGYETVRQFLADRINPQALPFSMEKMLGSPLYNDLYFDRKGRLKAARQYVQANGGKLALNVVSETVYDRYGKPEFTFRPQAGKVITWEELKQSMEEAGEAAKRRKNLSD